MRECAGQGRICGTNKAPCQPADPSLLRIYGRLEGITLRCLVPGMLYESRMIPLFVWYIKRSNTVRDTILFLSLFLLLFLSLLRTRLSCGYIDELAPKHCISVTTSPAGGSEIWCWFVRVALVPVLIRLGDRTWCDYSLQACSLKSHLGSFNCRSLLRS